MKRRLFSVFMAFAMILTLVYAPVEKEFLTVITAEAASIKSSEITARADYMYNLKWTAAADLTGYINSSGTVTKRYTAGHQYHVPYGQPTSSMGFIGCETSVDTFLNATKNASSAFYTKRGGGTTGSMSSNYYSLDCSGFTSYCWGVSRHTTSNWTTLPVTNIGVCNSNNVGKIKVGDTLLTKGHIKLVSRVNSDGTFEVTEETPPEIRRTTYTASELASNHSGYTIYRYNNVQYDESSPSPIIIPDTNTTALTDVVFDSNFYFNKYPDLQQAFGYNHDALASHWLTSGINEGRAGSMFLDLTEYVERNPDLKNAFGDDYRAAYNHFIETGCNEGRESSVVYDGEYYQAHNPDLAGMSGADLFWHFVNHGTHEGRQASAQFDPAYYRAMNPDVADAYGDDWYSYYYHYALYGYDEGRESVGSIINAAILNVSSSGYDVVITVVDQNRVTKIAVPVWTQVGSQTDSQAQDDLIANWQTKCLATKTGTNKYTYHVNTADHKKESGVYCTDIYVFEGNEIIDSWNIEAGKRIIVEVPAAVYKITFDANSGSVSPTSKDVTYGLTYGTLPTPTRNGYSFNGWYTAKTGGTKITDSTKVTLGGNQTLYAQWTAKEFTIKYDANGGSVSPTSAKVKMDAAYPSPPVPQRTGYTFNGWFTAKTGGTKITSSTKFTAATDQTLYAQWTAVPATTTTTTAVTTTTTTTTTTTSPELSLDKTSITLENGQQHEIKANQDNLTYKSNNTNVAVVSKKGIVTAVGEGNAIISVINADGDVAQLKVQVSAITIKGDCNGDGSFNISDVVLLQKWLLAVPDTYLENWKAANLCEDNRLDVFDLCLMKRELINS